MRPKLNTLCHECAQIFQPTYKVGDGGLTLTYDWRTERREKKTPDILIHHKSYVAFEKSAWEACHLCLLFWNQVPDHKRAVLREYDLEGRIAIYFPESQLHNSHQYDIILHYSFPPEARRDYGSRGFRMTLHMMGMTPNTTPKNIHGPLLSSTEDAASWATATKWIYECNKSHQNCPKISPSAAKASRLIFIGGKVDNSDLRLETRPGTGWNHNYVALSHCWGSSLPCKLLKGNLEVFHKRIPYEELTLTFQHAVKATRKLSKDFDISYLWIDALCIIQDSDEDWVKEAAIMGDIYEMAFTTLAATAGRNGEVGLFHQRNSLSLSPCIVDAQWSQSGRSFACEDRRALTSVIEKSALCSRAWVLQERALSPRILHFTAQQLFWECRTLDACEAYPLEIYKTKGIAHFKKFSLETWKLERGVGSDNTDNNAYLIWSVIVSRYTHATLTRESDKLIAIGGLAARFHAHFGPLDQYLGGLWKSQIPAQLLWKVVQVPRSRYPHDYRAPSWSWASVDGGIDAVPQQSDYESFHVDLLDCTIKYVNDDLKLGVEQGRLWLRGYIIALSRNIGVSLRDVDPDINVAPKIPLEIPGMQAANNSRMLQFDTTTGHVDNCRLYALAVASSQTGMSGLILRMTLDRRGEFKRCGWFKITESRDSEEFLLLARKSSLSQLEYEDVDEQEGRYTISMV